MGDDFGTKSFEQYFQSKKEEDIGYTKAHFDTQGYFTNGVCSDIPSLIARMSNLIANTIQCQHNRKLLPFPKNHCDSTRRRYH